MAIRTCEHPINVVRTHQHRIIMEYSKVRKTTIISLMAHPGHVLCPTVKQCSQTESSRTKQSRKDAFSARDAMTLL